MGLTMLLGVLRMPIELWDEDEVDKMQRHSRYTQAADLIEELKSHNNLLKENNQILDKHVKKLLIKIEGLKYNVKILKEQQKPWVSKNNVKQEF